MLLQDDLVQFAAAQKMEQQQCEIITVRLRTFAREFFQVDKEAEVARPLALLLGYIHSAAGEPLEARPGDASALALEGAVGQLQLFHACPMQPYSTKYQALFDPDAELDVRKDDDDHTQAGVVDWEADEFLRHSFARGHDPLAILPSGHQTRDAHHEGHERRMAK